MTQILNSDGEVEEYTSESIDDVKRRSYKHSKDVKQKKRKEIKKEEDERDNGNT